MASDAPPTDVVLIDHVKVDAAFAKGLPLLANSKYKISAGRRVTAGPVEIHANDTDIFYVLEGSAILAIIKTDDTVTTKRLAAKEGSQDQGG